MQISVVIPTYNRWPTVVRAIESAIDQTKAATQILVVDDGSTDNTVSHLKKRFGNTIGILEQSNKGVSAARNRAIEQATGNWVALLDSDDEWLPEKLQSQCDAVDAVKDAVKKDTDEEPVLVHTDEIWIRNGKRVNQAKKHQKRGGYIFEYCLPLCCISPSSALIKKETLTKLGGFDESLPACEDYDLWLRLCAQYSVTYIDRPLLIKYGGHEDQLSHKYWGMDRFRIQSLNKILHSTVLSEKQYRQTVDTLVGKAEIMLKGAIKHDNHEIANLCNNVLRSYSKHSN